MATTFIVNPRSAAGRTARTWAKIEKMALQAVGPSRTVYTSAPRHATDLTREALRSGSESIVAVGGDGTNNEIINGFFDASGRTIAPKATLGFLPCGTGGDLIRTLGIPRNPTRAIDVLKQPAVAMDVGRVRYTAHDGTSATSYFLNVSGFGASGDVDARVNRSSKRLGGKASFAIGTLASLINYRNPTVRFSVDEAPTEESRLNTIFVCNARYAGGGMLLSPTAEINDGLLEIIVVGDLTKADSIWSARLLYTGKIGTHRKVRLLRGRRLTATPISPEPILIDLDGEQPGKLPATWEILPSAVRVHGSLPGARVNKF